IVVLAEIDVARDRGAVASAATRVQGRFGGVDVGEALDAHERMAVPEAGQLVAAEDLLGVGDAVVAAGLDPRTEVLGGPAEGDPAPRAGAAADADGALPEIEVALVRLAAVRTEAEEVLARKAVVAAVGGREGLAVREVRPGEARF